MVPTHYYVILSAILFGLGVIAFIFLFELLLVLGAWVIGPEVVRTSPIPNLDNVTNTAALGQVITPPAELCCDGGAAITAFARRARVKVHVLPAPGTPRPERPISTSTM